MSTVTAIRPKGRRTDRFVVEVDGAALATIDLDLWARHGLGVGAALDEGGRERLVDGAGRLCAYDRAVRMLACRGRAKEELRRRLVEKGALPAHAADAVERLVRAGLLDDAAFAHHYARSRALVGHGKRRLLAELARKGIARDLASQAVGRVLADPTVDAAGALETLAERRLKSLARLDEPTRQRRLFAFLVRRGHGAADIARVLKGMAR